MEYIRFVEDSGSLVPKRTLRSLEGKANYGTLYASCQPHDAVSIQKP